MLNHTFTFNGHSSDEFGIKIERFRALNRPARKFDAASVPGRNGNIYKLQDAYEEVLVSYQIWAKEDGTLEDVWTNIMEWLNSADGYAELSDTYDTEHYREAVFVDATDIENSWNEYGRALVTFRCRPERFLNNARAIQLTGSASLAFVRNANTNIYASASTSWAVVAVVAYASTLVEVLSTSGTWKEVRLKDGTEGWCQASALADTYGDIITNPTNHVAKPSIIIMGAAPHENISVRIDDLTLSTKYGGTATENIIISCENEDVRSSLGVNLNKYTSITDPQGSTTIADFLNLDAGINYVRLGHPSGNVLTGTVDARFWEV